MQIDTQYLLIRFILLVWLCLFLSACQTTGRQSPQPYSDLWLSDESVFAAQRDNYLALQRWKYSAKVGVSTDAGREQANMIWDFHEKKNHVRLYGPLGAGTVKIDFDQDYVSLSDNKGVLHQGISAQTLLTKVTGWTIPIDVLPYWLFVLPAPNVDFEYQIDHQGNIKALRQSGWQINFSDYRNYSGTLLPRKLTAIRDPLAADITQNSNNKTSVKIISKNWQWQ